MKMPVNITSTLCSLSTSGDTTTKEALDTSGTKKSTQRCDQTSLKVDTTQEEPMLMAVRTSLLEKMEWMYLSGKVILTCDVLISRNHSFGKSILANQRSGNHLTHIVP